jgi:hypothetical protein
VLNQSAGKSCASLFNLAEFATFLAGWKPKNTPNGAGEEKGDGNDERAPGLEHSELPMPMGTILCATSTALLHSWSMRCGRAVDNTRSGFISFARGWDPLRPEDLGVLWEHLVLEQLLAYFPEVAARYWRDKSGNEIDFVLPRRRDQIDTVECKWNPDAFDPGALAVFRGYYPGGNNYLVAPNADPPYSKMFGKLKLTVCTPSALRSDGN